MIEVPLGSKNAERVLIYIFSRDEGYARKSASFYGTDLKPIQMQDENVRYAWNRDIQRLAHEAAHHGLEKVHEKRRRFV